MRKNAPVLARLFGLAAVHLLCACADKPSSAPSDVLRERSDAGNTYYSPLSKVAYSYGADSYASSTMRVYLEGPLLQSPADSSNGYPCRRIELDIPKPGEQPRADLRSAHRSSTNSELLIIDPPKGGAPGDSLVIADLHDIGKSVAPDAGKNVAIYVTKTECLEPL